MDRRAIVASALLSALAASVLRAQPARPGVQLGFLRIVATPRCTSWRCRGIHAVVDARQNRDNRF
jgi:hypothetical protein